MFQVTPRTHILFNWLGLRVKCVILIMLIPLAALSCNRSAQDIAKTVMRDICGEDLCLGEEVLIETGKVFFGEYQINLYEVGGTSHGSVAAVFRDNINQLQLLRVFKGLGANGRVRKITPKRLDVGLFLEVYEETSKGNGAIELFQLSGDRLSLLFEARGVDEHDDGFMYDGGILNATYYDLNGDGHFDIELQGMVIATQLAENEKSTWPRKCKRVFLWDSNRKSFVETERGENYPELCSEFK
jgi:hypothetical protein